MLIPDDGRKAEACSKFMEYIISVHISLLTVPDNKNYLTVFNTDVSTTYFPHS